MRKDVVVVGAGVAGLTLAHQLCHKNNVFVVEKEAMVGGLARSFRYGNFIFDIGPHRFHTEDALVLNYIKRILGDNTTIIDRRSGVYLDGKYHEWPLRPNTLPKLKPSIMLKTLVDLLQNRDAEINSFEDYIKVKYGGTLYTLFFKRYTEKFTHTKCSKIHPLWAESGIDRAVIDNKIKMNTLGQLIKTSLLPKAVKTRFIYPPKGMWSFSDKIADNIRKHGSLIDTNSIISKLGFSESRINFTSWDDREIQPTHLYWSAPITTLVELLGTPKIKLRYLSTVCYNIEVDAPTQKNFQWCYYGNEDIIFIRTTHPVLFSPKNAPKGKSSICAEVTCFMGDKTWNKPDKLVDRVINDVEVVGLATESNVGQVHIEKVANTYPLYTIDYPQELDKLMSMISDIENLTVFGRCGRFHYNNMDHSIKEALTLKNRLKSSIKNRT